MKKIIEREGEEREDGGASLITSKESRGTGPNKRDGQ
jgi:hypothetical protein